jgi:hypothetical protein
VSAGWVAASTRGRGLARRRLGREAAAETAHMSSLAAAVDVLVAGPYGHDVRTGMNLAAAQHAVWATCLWHLRVLAGWGPPLGAGALRALTAGFEIANVTGHLARMTGGRASQPFALGSLASVWPAVAGARTPQEVRSAVAASTWGDPGTDDVAGIRLAMEFAWARRVVDGAPEVGDWAVSKAALVLARVMASGARGGLGPTAQRDIGHVLGPRWQEASTPTELARLVPRGASRVLAELSDPSQLWRAEVRWWADVETSGAALAGRVPPDVGGCLGVAGLLATDAWRVGAALALAAHGGGDLAGVLDAVA